LQRRRAFNAPGDAHDVGRRFLEFRDFPGVAAANGVE
jgi:hypothetical protein